MFAIGYSVLFGCLFGLYFYFIFILGINKVFYSILFIEYRDNSDKSESMKHLVTLFDM